MMAQGDGRMAGKVVVMTGATSGLGAVAAVALASRGARLVIVARDATRGEATLAALRQANPAVEPTLQLADLSRLADAKRVAAAIAAAEPRIDVLCNNAGAMFGTVGITEDGLERTFATNHMATVVLTLGLHGSLAAAGGARVVNTASAAHTRARFDPADIQTVKPFSGWVAYCRSKLYNVLFTRELARRWQGDDITANSFHPGVVKTRLGDGGGGWLEVLFRGIKLVGISPAQGAATLIHLAAAPEVAGMTGLYFDKSRAVRTAPAGADDRAAATLWAESLRLAGLPA